MNIHNINKLHEVYIYMKYIHILMYINIYVKINECIFKIHLLMHTNNCNYIYL
jgi:hypothetical protein